VFLSQSRRARKMPLSTNQKSELAYLSGATKVDSIFTRKFVVAIGRKMPWI